MMKKFFASLLLGLGLICGVNAAENNGPVLHLKFDEGIGNTAKDVSGNGLDAELRNIAWEEFGVQGRRSASTARILQSCSRFPGN